MINQLKELLEMQKALDEAILKERGIKEYPYENMRIALFVELGELMNEFPSKFKHWKKNAIDNHEKGLEEYVDCLHFKLSIYNYEYTCKDIFHDLPDYNKCIQKAPCLRTLIEISFEFSDFNSFFVLGNILGFTWEEIYNAYKKKNQVNYERLKNGY